MLQLVFWGQVEYKMVLCYLDVIITSNIDLTLRHNVPFNISVTCFDISLLWFIGWSITMCGDFKLEMNDLFSLM